MQIAADSADTRTPRRRTPVRVALDATDPVSVAGLTRLLESRTDLMLVDGARRDTAAVTVACADRLTPDVIARLRHAATETGRPVVLVIREITETEVLTAAGCRVVGVLPRVMVTSERLAGSVHAAADGGGALSSSMIGLLLQHVEHARHDALTTHGLDEREIEVLRLTAEGLDHAEIASRLRYSERTVKNIVYGITHRLKLRNRPHAVAYALRAGLI
jgi:DNA-binding NarL/FixJ family response regulator